MVEPSGIGILLASIVVSVLTSRPPGLLGSVVGVFTIMSFLICIMADLFGLSEFSGYPFLFGVVLFSTFLFMAFLGSFFEIRIKYKKPQHRKK